MGADDLLTVAASVKDIEKGVQVGRLDFRQPRDAHALGFLDLLKQLFGAEIGVFLKEGAADLDAMRDHGDPEFLDDVCRQESSAIRYNPYFAHECAGLLE